MHGTVTFFKCDYRDCTYDSKSKVSLEAHVMKHAGVKTYKCNLCDQAFTTNQHKNRHIKILIREIISLTVLMLTVHSAHQ